MKTASGQYCRVVSSKTSVPFAFTATPATGEGLTTAFTVFDSLGNPVEVRLRLAMETRGDSGTTWRFFAESITDSDASPLLGTGTLSFDQDGRLVASTGTTLNVDLSTYRSRPIGHMVSAVLATSVVTSDYVTSFS